MKNKIFFHIIYALAFAVTVVNVVFSMKNYLNADINELPKGELLSTSESPSGDRQVNVYLVKNSLGSAIRGELVIGNRTPKNIFWQTGIDTVKINWESDYIIYFDSIPISGTGKLPYDCRRGTSLFTDGALIDGQTGESLTQ